MRTSRVAAQLERTKQLLNADPTGNPSNYDVRSDVWSFGISMMEIAMGSFPYRLWATPFEQLKQVISAG